MTPWTRGIMSRGVASDIAVCIMNHMSNRTTTNFTTRIRTVDTATVVTTISDGGYVWTFIVGQNDTLMIADDGRMVPLPSPVSSDLDRAAEAAAMTAIEAAL